MGNIVERQKFVWIVTAIACVAVLWFCSTVDGQSSVRSWQTVGASLRDNIVSLEVRGSSVARGGFGIIVGRRANTVYVATANHVVRNRSDSTVPQVVARYFNQPGLPVTAELLSMQLETHDLAFLGIPPPALPRWSEPSMAQRPATPGADVGFYGVSGQWIPSARTGKVKAVEVQASRYVITGLDIDEGSSGTALMSAAGIEGLILTGQTALQIDFVRRFADSFNIPWDLLAYEPPPSCEAVPVCLSRTDQFAAAVTLVGLAANVAVQPGGNRTCLSLVPPALYTLVESDRRIACKPDVITAECGMASLQPVECEVSLDGDWDSTWGTISLVGSFSGKYSFVGLSSGPMGASEGTAVVQGSHITLTGRGLANGRIAGWRAVGEVTLTEMTVQVTADNNAVYSVVLRRR
jgi:hypothetical protein